MPLLSCIGLAVQFVEMQAFQLATKLYLPTIDLIEAIPMLTGTTVFANQSIDIISKKLTWIDATLFDCQLTKLYRFYYPLPVIAEPILPPTFRQIATKMLSSFTNGFWTNTIYLCAALYVVLCICVCLKWCVFCFFFLCFSTQILLEI